MRDGADNEIVRHGPANFLGELNLVSGQGVYLTAVVSKPLRYIAVEREVLRDLLFDDEPLSALLLTTFIARREALQQVAGLGLEIVGPRSSSTTRRLLEFARNNRLPVTWRDPERGDDQEAAALIAGLDASSLPLARLPGGTEMRGRRLRESCLARLGLAASSPRARTSTCLSWVPARPDSVLPLRCL